MSHTPGPWHLLQFGTVEFIDGHKEPAWQVMSCHPHEGLPHQTDARIAQNLTNEANARLITAAPDLLTALEEMTGWFGTDDGLRGGIGRARAAIAKAKGEQGG
jgi:hypothetical protein